MIIFKLILALVALIIVSSIVMLFLRRLRRAGLIMLGSLIIIFLVIILVFFSPRQYERKYLQRSEEWKSLTFRQYADSLGFYIGTIPGGTDISDPVFCNNLNSVTPENSLKMGPLFRDKKIGEYDFTEADRIVNQALEKKLRVRGHTLVWGKQSDMFKRIPTSGPGLKHSRNQREAVD